VLVTNTGVAVQESLNIIQYVDEVQSAGKAPLSAAQQYALSFFYEQVEGLVGAMVGYMFGGMKDPQGLKEGAAGVVKALEAKPFGPGPFFGGKEMNMGDVALIPFLVRLKALNPALVPYNVLADFPPLAELLKAAIASPHTKGIFLPDQMYVEILTKLFQSMAAKK